MPNLGEHRPVHPFVERGPAIFQKNLAALREVQPAVATTVAAASLPSLEPVWGRDGTPTLKLRDAAGNLTWFGGSSMPSVSAAEMFRSVDADVGNYSLFGVLTGIEPLVILDALPAYRALFVIEDDPANLRLAMHLHDYAEAVRSGRLVFVLNDDVAGRLKEYFQARPGCEMPVRMFTVPNRPASATAELQRRLELAGEGVLQIQSRTVEALTASIRSVPRGGLGDAPRVAVVTVDPSASTLDFVERASRALSRLGWSRAVAVPDRPDRCHIVARIQAVERAAADFVLVVNGFPGPVRTLLSVELPIVSWFSLSGVVPQSLGAAVGPFDLFLSTSRSQLEALRSAGVPEEAVRLCGGAVSDAGRVGGGGARVLDAAMATDLPDARAEACGINLASHVLLWEELWKIGCGNEEIVARTDSWLEQAERQCRVRLQAAGVREQFIGLLRARMVPAVVGGSIFAALRHSGVRVGVWGSGWAALPAGGVSSRGPVPVGKDLQDLLASTHRLVLLSLGSVGVQMGLDALRLGVEVLVRGERESFDEDHPGLVGIAGLFTFWRGRAEFVHRVSTSRHEETGVSERLVEHTMTRRLLEMRDEIRRRQAARIPLGSEV